MATACAQDSVGVLPIDGTDHLTLEGDSPLKEQREVLNESGVAMDPKEVVDESGAVEAPPDLMKQNDDSDTSCDNNGVAKDKGGGNGVAAGDDNSEAKGGEDGDEENKTDDCNEVGESDDEEDDDDDDDDDNDDDNDGDEDSSAEDDEESSVSQFVVDEYGNKRELSAYERMRMERIRRNQQYLAKLGLEEAKASKLLEKKKALKRPQSSNSPKDTEGDEGEGENVDDEDNTQRRKSSRRTRTVDYSELPSRVRKDDESTKNDATAVEEKPTPTVEKTKKKKESMNAVIFLEFKRLEKERRVALKRAERDLRAALVEHRYAKRHADAAEKKLEQRRVAKLWDEVELKKARVLASVRKYDLKREMAWMVAQSRHTQFKNAQREAIAALPTAIPCIEQTFDQLLLERCPQDFDPVFLEESLSYRRRRPKRKRKQPDPDTENSKDAPPAANCDDGFPAPLMTSRSNLTKRKAEDAPFANDATAPFLSSGILSENTDAKPKARRSEKRRATDVSTNETADDAKSPHTGEGRDGSEPPSKARRRSRGRPAEKSKDTISTAASIDKSSPEILDDCHYTSEPEQSTKKKESKTQSAKGNIRLVAGPVSVEFGNKIERTWLSADAFQPVNASKVSSYVPQAGDLVLYYAIGHSEFLKKNPDQRPNRCRSKLRIPLWNRTSAVQAKKQRRFEDQGTKKFRGSSLVSTGEDQHEESNSSTWWNQAWLSSLFDGFDAKYPILCRVESTIAEFPFNPLGKEDGGLKNGMPTDKPTSSPKRKKKVPGPPLMMSVTLKPLAPVLPPSAGHDLQAPPTLTVSIFPSDLPPYIIPFLWAFDTWQALCPGESVEVQSVGRRVQEGKVMSLDGESLAGCTNELAGILHRFELQSQQESEEQILDDVVLSYGLGRKATPSCVDFPPAVLRALLQLVRVRLSAEKYEPDVSYGATLKVQTHGSLALAISNVLRQTLPLWEGVNIELADGTRMKASVWELTRPKGEPLTSGTFGDSSPERFGHVYGLESGLRTEIEATIRSYLKDNELADPFVSPVTSDIAPCYHCFVPVMMYFRRILRRLRCGHIKVATDKKNAPKDKNTDSGFCYYRSVASVLSDVAAIAMNCILYNEPESEIVRNANIVSNEVKKHIMMLETARNRELHQKEKESLNRLKEREVEAQKKHDEDSGAGEDAVNQSKMGKRVVSFNVPLDRTWMEATEPDDSWESNAMHAAGEVGGKARLIGATEVQGSSSTPWFPQSGDQILYCPEHHKDFVSGHSRSLSVEQRNVPHVFPRKNGTKETAPIIDQKTTLDGGVNSGGNKQRPSWLVGCVVWTSASFPPKPTKSRGENGFEVLTPILAIALQLQYPWAAGKTFIVHWRPCTLHQTPRQKKTQDASGAIGEAQQTGPSPTFCTSCGLKCNESFIRPAWIGPLQDVVPTEAGAPSFLMPQGLLGRDRIAACLELLKQRCVQGVPPDSTDSGSTAKRLKTPYINLNDISVTPESVVCTDEGSVVGLQKEPATVATRHGGEKLRNSIRATLAKVHFLPPWSAPTSDEMNGAQAATSDAKDPKLSRHMAVLPIPNLSLELILCRIRNGYYRQALAAINDLREAYVTSVLFVLSGRTVVQGGKALSSRLILSQLVGMPMSLIQPMEDFDNSQAQSVEGAEGTGTNELSTKDLELVGCFKQVRRLYATAVLCLTKLATAEFAFGIIQSPANRRPTPQEVALESRRAAARKAMEGILAPLMGDRFGFRFHSTDVRKVTVKVRLKGFVAPLTAAEKPISPKDGGNVGKGGPGSSPESCGFPPIIVKGEDFDASPNLVGAFFKRGNHKDSCVRCKLGRRGTFYCRVRKGHSNPDWGEAIANLEEAGGIENILCQLLPDEADRADVGREVAGVGFGAAPFAGLALKPDAFKASGRVAVASAAMMSPQQVAIPVPAQMGFALKQYADKAHGGVGLPLASMLNPQTASVARVGFGAAPVAGLALTRHDAGKLPGAFAVPIANVMNSQTASVPVGFGAAPVAGLMSTLGGPTALVPSANVVTSQTVSVQAVPSGGHEIKQEGVKASQGLDHTTSDVIGSQKESDTGGSVMTQTKAQAVAANHGSKASQGVDSSVISSPKEPDAGGLVISQTEAQAVAANHGAKASQGVDSSVISSPKEPDAGGSVISQTEAQAVAANQSAKASQGVDSTTSDLVTSQKESNKESNTVSSVITQAEAKVGIATVEQKEQSAESRSVALFAKAERALELAQLAMDEANKEILAPIRLSDKFIKSSFPYDPADAHYEYCVICARSGDVICCESCAYVAHPGCVGLEKVPEEDWFCHKCTREKEQKEGAKSEEEEVAEARAARRKMMLELLDELKSARLGPSKIADSGRQNAKATKDKEETVSEEKPKDDANAEVAEESGDKPDGAEEGDETGTEKKRLKRKSTDEEESAGVELGARIMKSFEEYGDYQGLVTCIPSAENPYYRVRYEDGDEEDMSEDEVCRSAAYWNEKASKETLQEKPCKRKRGRPRKDSRVSQLEAATSSTPHKKIAYTPKMTSAKKPKKVQVSKSTPVAKTPPKVTAEPSQTPTEKKEARGPSPPPSKSGVRSSSRHRTPPDRLQAGMRFFL